jgi:hypothetical protein
MAFKEDNSYYLHWLGFLLTIWLGIRLRPGCAFSICFVFIPVLAILIVSCVVLLTILHLVVGCGCWERPN